MDALRAPESLRSTPPGLLAWLVAKGDHTSTPRFILDHDRATWNTVFVAESGQTRQIGSRSIEIRRLPTSRLQQPICARLSYEDGEWLAEGRDLPLYGSGETEADACDMLAREVESLWQDLNEDVGYGEEMLLALRVLRNLIVQYAGRCRASSPIRTNFAVDAKPSFVSIFAPTRSRTVGLSTMAFASAGLRFHSEESH